MRMDTARQGSPRVPYWQKDETAGANSHRLVHFVTYRPVGAVRTGTSFVCVSICCFSDKTLIQINRTRTPFTLIVFLLKRGPEDALRA